MALLQLSDEIIGHSKDVAMTLEVEGESLTVRELLRRRIQAEVEAYNAKLAEDAAQPVRMLVTPTVTEQRLNAKASKIAAHGPKKREVVDWEKQFLLACHAFDSNGFFLLVGDRQCESLDEPIVMQDNLDVTFVKLVPLVGG